MEQSAKSFYCMKYPNRYMPLLQYSGLLNNLSNKFPFDQVYAYDKEFRADLQWNQDKPWNVIDNQLWSMCLHGNHTLPHQGNPKQYNFKKTSRPSTGQQRGNSETSYKHCFDYNRGGCNRPSCVFPHICGKCGSTSHTISYCRSGNNSGFQQQQQTQGRNNSSNAASGSSIPNRGTVRASNTSQGSKTTSASMQVSRQ